MSSDPILAARTLFARRASGRVLIVPDADADGLSSAAIVWRAVERLGGTPLVLHPRRGEHAHSSAVRHAIPATDPDLVVVLDMGSRGGSIAPGIPTLVVDHHVVEGVPEDAVFVSGAARSPQTSTSALTFEVLSPVAPIEDARWLAAVGLQGDLGPRSLRGFQVGVPAKVLSSAVSLVNAANRSASRDLEAAMSALLAASGPEDLVQRRVPQADRLFAMRDEVTAEANRCAKTRPTFAGPFALLLFSSRARVHPLVAVRWKGRLKDSIVIAANRGYLPSRVNFAMRSAQQIDLIAVLKSFELPPGEEVAHGHPQATGGSLPQRDFERLMRQMGFGDGANVELTT